MAKKFVNLDALLPREDFEVEEENFVAAENDTRITIRDLEKGSFLYSALRKPDFQRETANWSPQHIVDFIRSFIDGDLIPAVILWQSPKSKNLFVIDGAHRLSALIGWVHDDFGDKAISLAFYNGAIQPEQEWAAQETRHLASDQLRSYEAYQHAARYEANSPPDLVAVAKGLGVRGLPIQWVRGDAKKAEESFFRINQKPTPIDQTELQMIQCRTKPNAIAARAVVRAGSGHRFWSGFTPANQALTEGLAKEIHENLFSPTLETPIKTLDLPVAGQGYSPASLRLVFEFVNAVNGTRTPAKIRDLEDDQDGTATVGFLRETRKYARLIASNQSGSMGLHPAVYFYGATGTYVAPAFLATLQFLMELQKRKALVKFTEERCKFEDFLVSRSHFINQIVHSKGSGFRSVPSLLNLFISLYECLVDGIPEDELTEEIRSRGKLAMLTDSHYAETGKGAFSTPAKNAAFLKEALESALRCSICNARVYRKAISIDHGVRKQDGGSSHSDNAFLTHPYCNNTVKEQP